MARVSGVTSNQQSSGVAYIGLRAKTARAIAVVLTGPVETPVAIKRAELTFATMAEPAIFQPYHEVLDLPWNQGQAAVKKPEALLVSIAAARLGRLLDELSSEGLKVRTVGIVGAPNRNLEGLGSPHIRAHAAEGVLFRRILEGAAGARRLQWRAFSERDLEQTAALELGLTAAELLQKLAAFGRTLGRPWRADEKAAAIGAWLAQSTFRSRPA